VNNAGQLISGYFDASLNDEEVEQLDSLLQTDGEQASLFARLAILHSAIRDTVEIERSFIDLPAVLTPDDATEPYSASDPGSTLLGLPANLPQETAEGVTPEPAPAAPMPLKKPQRKPPGRLGRRTALAAAILLLFGAALIMLLHHAGMFGGSSPQPIATGQTLDAIWTDPISVPAAGSLIKTGVSQSLASGCAELTSTNGLRVVVQGPATFTIEGPGVLSLTSGRLTASVPKAARGFTVETPFARAVDLGTEFGVSVSPMGDTDIQTFQGTVSLTSTTGGTASPATLITTGIARHVGPAGNISEIPADSVAYVRPQQFDEWKAMPQGTPYERWKAYSQRLRADPDLVAYYTFDKSDASPEVLLNCAATGAALDGVLLGPPERATGRWQQKGALSFSANTHQHIDIPALLSGPLDFSRGESTARPFTICIWLRAEEQRPVHSSILLKGGGAEQMRIELFPDKSIEASVGTDIVADHQNPASKITNGWQQVTLNYDPDHGHLALYVNGIQVAQNPNASAVLVQLNAPLAIGNREFRRGHAPYLPPMVGRMDELAVFRRALSAEEVKNMYLAEKPD
jgi:hypothetical protein